MPHAHNFTARLHTIVSVTDEQQPNETTAQARARFEKLAMPAVNALYRQAMKLTNNPDDAQDLVQDTFERGFKAFDSFEDGSNFEAWMTTIERNAYFNQYAKAKRRPQRANDSTGEYDDWDIYAASGALLGGAEIRGAGVSGRLRAAGDHGGARKTPARAPAGVH